MDDIERGGRYLFVISPTFRYIDLPRIPEDDDPIHSNAIYPFPRSIKVKKQETETSVINALII